MAGTAADFFQHGAAFSDDDSFMGFFFADDLCLDVEQAVGAFFHFLDGHGDPVGDLVLETAQRFLTDDLCCDLAHRLVGHGVLIVVHRPAGQILHDHFQNGVQVVAL